MAPTIIYILDSIQGVHRHFQQLSNKEVNPKSYTLWVRIPLKQSVHDTPLCDKSCQWFATGRWFSPGTPVSSTDKTHRHDIAEILMKGRTTP